MGTNRIKMTSDVTPGREPAQPRGVRRDNEQENVERPDAGAIHVRSAAGRPLKRIQIGRDPPMRQVSRTNVVRRQMRNLWRSERHHGRERQVHRHVQCRV